jgi:hypothetical protein
VIITPLCNPCIIAMSLHHHFKWRNWKKVSHRVPCRPPWHSSNLSPYSPLHHVHCLPCITLNTLVLPLSKETHARSQHARAQHLATACQTRGDRAPTQPWTRQYTPSPGLARPPLPLSLGTHDHHHPSYTLDMLERLRVHPSPRHDQLPAATVLHGRHHRQLASDPL